MTDESIPFFSELHVISDLHLGGKPGFQMFPSDHAELLEQFLKTNKWPDRDPVALVINGDLVDFLAEEKPAHFDARGAVTKLNRIMNEEPAFAGVWNGLRAFLEAPTHFLAITLGNHDIELALPWVRDKLLETLSGGDPQIRDRITLAFDGLGFRCRVGKAKNYAEVLCVHGNEVDVVNQVDYEILRRRGQEYVWRGETTPWVPNQGTALVIGVMNDIKKKHPFVDLLKPETGAVIPTLLALDPSLVTKAPSLVFGALRRVDSWVKEKVGVLGPGDPSADYPGTGWTQHPVTGAPEPELIDPDVLLALTEQRLKDRVDPFDLVDIEGYLWEWSDLYGWVPKLVPTVPPWMRELLSGDRSRALRQALSWLVDDQQFAPYEQDSTLRGLDRQVAHGIDLLIAGHTHIERGCRRTVGNGNYFNSGTWARVMRLSPEVLASHEEFQPVFKALQQSSIDALDNLVDGKLAIADRRPAVVSIWAKANGVFGELRRVRWEQENGGKRTVVTEIVPESIRFAKR
jgi:UDP-2,3-diacylglucosamine pyrophosphatase LpxH